MDHIETVDAIVDLANTGRHLSADEALGAVVKLINDMCPTARNYDSRLAALMEIGATLWNLSEAIRHSQPDTSQSARLIARSSAFVISQSQGLAAAP